jgi:hypothetical protein
MGRLDQTEQKGDREENPKRASSARTSDQAISKIPKKLWGDLTQILDSVRQLIDVSMTSGPGSRLERHNRFVDEVIE